MATIGMNIGTMDKTNLEPWLSVEEIANHLGISKETVYRWLEKRKIPAHRVGKLWKFKASEVDTWVKNGSADDSAHFSKDLSTSNIYT